MNKTEYMNALQLALQGLPAQVIEETLWTYEGKFTEGILTGKKEQDIAAGLPLPGLVAARKKTALRFQAFKTHVSPGNLASLLVALIGLLVFNLFMVIPAIVYVSLLCASYAVALLLYVAGIGMTAASLSGVQQFSVALPAAYYHAMDGDIDMDGLRSGEPLRVDISQHGILIDQDGAPAPAARDAGTSADGRLRLEIDNHLTIGDVWQGIGILLGSILLLLFSMVLTKYSFFGLRQYLRWNLAQLKIHQHV